MFAGFGAEKYQNCCVDMILSSVNQTMLLAPFFAGKIGYFEAEIASSYRAAFDSPTISGSRYIIFQVPYIFRDSNSASDGIPVKVLCTRLWQFIFQLSVSFLGSPPYLWFRLE